MTNEPTLGEVVRRLESMDKKLDRQDQQRALYVLKETYDAHKEARDREIKEVKDDVETLFRARETDSRRRRSDALLIGLTVIGWLITIVLAVVALIGGK